LVVAADGRTSVMRDNSALHTINVGAPMDVEWFKIARRSGDTDETIARFDTGSIFVMLNRGDYWQCAFVIPKGANTAIQSAGLAAFQARVARAAPFVADRVSELTDWEQIKLLTVAVDRLMDWSRPGLLCIGDAAHAMSPVGGVGINLAVQDAVAAANILYRPLRDGHVTMADVAHVQARRMWPTRVTQALQLMVQNRVIAPTLRLISKVPMLQRIPGRLIGLGVRPEHVCTEIAMARI
jgi:2-polyprenyl-6-methoxyphenol hydroxylase-like FAD-dependent oxidoreductase